MDNPNAVSQFLSVFGAVVLAAGSAGAVVMALLVWLERAWTARIRQREFSEMNIRITETQAELTSSYKRQKEDTARLDADYRQQFAQLSIVCSDSMKRKRDIYTELATTIRLLVQAGDTLDKRHWNDFQASYDLAFMWASEGVIEAIHEFSEAMDNHAADKVAIYQHCLIEMRKDSGFPDSHASSQRVVRPRIQSIPNRH